MQAIILAAGKGTRLSPFTDFTPKCLVRVHEKSILERQLEALNTIGIQRCCVVVGYRGAQIGEEFGSKFNNVSLSYIENPLFDSTNNIYSLWLTRHIVDDDLLLLEGDILFDHQILRNLLNHPGENVSLVDHYKPSMSGTIIFSANGTATDMVLKSAQGINYDYQHALKTVNIYKISYQTLQSNLWPIVHDYISRGLTKEYYESCIAALIKTQSIDFQVLHTNNLLWCEIDTKEDLEQAMEWQWENNQTTLI